MAYRFDPDLASVVGLLPVLDLRDIAGARALITEMTARSGPFVPPPMLNHSVIKIRSDPTNSDLALYVLAPRHRTALSPCVVWFHGGGFVLGHPTDGLAANAQMAEELGAVVISVDYRLAPEYPYPAAVDDGMAALRWIVDHAAELEIDTTRIAVAGESAGACLATVMTLSARDTGGPDICFQALDSPVIDDRLQTESMRQFTDTPLWTRGNAELSWKAYLRNVFDGTVPGYAAPGRVEDLTGLPPAYISACEIDPLRDEALQYGQRLAQCGVPTEIHLYPGTFHGSASSITEAAISKRMRRELLAALGRGLRVGARTDIEV